MMISISPQQKSLGWRNEAKYTFRPFLSNWCASSRFLPNENAIITVPAILRNNPILTWVNHLNISILLLTGSGPFFLSNFLLQILYNFSNSFSNSFIISPQSLTANAGASMVLSHSVKGLRSL